MTRVGVVVIGRNEGERLRRCLSSVLGGGRAVVYADSGSTDGSAAAAREMGAAVVELDSSAPFTAARGRNAGAEHLRAGDPAGEGPPYIQFVDGDCELDPAWLDRGAGELDSDSTRAIVCGHLREKHRESSVFARLCDMEWRGPVGRIDACGGIFMIRAAAFRQVGGFVPGQAVGEEPDLCARLRQAGWSVVRIDAPMGVHDAAMTRLGQWWARTVRAGYYHAQAASRSSSERSLARGKRAVGTAVWSVGLPLAVIAGAASPVREWAAPAMLLLAAAAYGALLYKVYRYRRRRGDGPSDARLYSVFCVLAKWPELIGQVKFWLSGATPRSGTSRT